MTLQLLQSEKKYQLTSFSASQSFHKNISCHSLEKTLEELLPQFSSAFLRTEREEIQGSQREGRWRWKRRPLSFVAQRAHDRKKRHILPEGEPNSYLIHLGLMGKEGKIISAKYHKFQQINRFLELIEHALPASTEPFHIVDLGCGKAYLTFALYHYMREIKGIDAHLTGVDHREDVIVKCRRLASDLGYSHLQFFHQSIHSYQPKRPVDAVVSLHACNLATDEALALAVQWRAASIFAVPCCQQELLSQIESPSLQSILRHGILKERLASLATDALRAELLTVKGYRAQVIEFVSAENSPKNLMIRAQRLERSFNIEAWKRYKLLKEQLNLNPLLEKLLKIEE